MARKPSAERMDVNSLSSVRNNLRFLFEVVAKENNIPALAMLLSRVSEGNNPKAKAMVEQALARATAVQFERKKRMKRTVKYYKK